jgi:hypothetical protein
VETLFNPKNTPPFQLFLTNWHHRQLQVYWHAVTVLISFYVTNRLFPTPMNRQGDKTGLHKSRAIKFFTVMPNTCGFLITVLALYHSSGAWILWKTCGPLHSKGSRVTNYHTMYGNDMLHHRVPAVLTAKARLTHTLRLTKKDRKCRHNVTLRRVRISASWFVHAVWTVLILILLCANSEKKGCSN